MPVPVVSLVGKSGVGKTTLLEKLLPELARRGRRAGTLKHDAHDFEMDHPGKDSFRHFHAGSAVAGIASDGKFGMVKRLEAPRGVFDFASAFFPDVDILLTEGFKKDATPKIEISRKALGERLLCDRGRDRLVAVVADHVPRGIGRVPVFDPDDIAGLADFLEKRFMKKCCAASVGFSVKLVVDKKRIPIKPFVQNFIAGSVLGMTGALRGVKAPKSITVSIERKGR